MPAGFESPHSIHPATLDSLFHLILVTLGGDTSMRDAAVPFNLARMFIASEQPHSPDSQFYGYAERTSHAGGEISADLVLSDRSWAEPKIILESLVMRHITSRVSDILSITGQKRCARIVWKLDPYLNLLCQPEYFTINVPQEHSHPGLLTNLQRWLELECHKNRDLNVLFVGNNLGPALAHELEFFLLGTSQEMKFTRFTLTDESEEQLQIWRECFDQSIVSTSSMIWWLIRVTDLSDNQ